MVDHRNVILKKLQAQRSELRINGYHRGHVMFLNITPKMRLFMYFCLEIVVVVTTRLKKTLYKHISYSISL